MINFYDYHIIVCFLFIFICKDSIKVYADLARICVSNQFKIVQKEKDIFSMWVNSLLFRFLYYLNYQCPPSSTKIYVILSFG